MAKCVWCEDEFEDNELTLTKLGHLCDTCIRAIESRGESVNDEEPEYALDVRKADEEWEKLRDIVEDGDVDEICDACRAFIKLHKADPVKFMTDKPEESDVISIYDVIADVNKNFRKDN